MITTNRQYAKRQPLFAQLQNYLNDRPPQLIIKITEIKTDSDIDLILKARRLCRQYPSITESFFPATAGNPERIANAFKSIKDKSTAIEFILEVEAEGLI